MQSNLFTSSPSVQSSRILYTPSPFARSSLLHLQEIGSLTVAKPHTCKRKKLQSYLCFIVEDWEGELVMDKPEILQIKSYTDFRGWLSVPLDQELGFHVVQINQGYSKKAFTLRGLHYQEEPYSQAKLVSCLHGAIYSVAVDIRPGESFGYAYGHVLSFENQKQMLIPRGFAHGYLTLEDDTLMQWCVDNHFCGGAVRAIRYDDSGLIWQTEPWLKGEYILSEKDKNAASLY